MNCKALSKFHRRRAGATLFLWPDVALTRQLDAVIRNVRLIGERHDVLNAIWSFQNLSGSSTSQACVSVFASASRVKHSTMWVWPLYITPLISTPQRDSRYPQPVHLRPICRWSGRAKARCSPDARPCSCEPFERSPDSRLESHLVVLLDDFVDMAVVYPAE